MSSPNGHVSRGILLLEYQRKLALSQIPADTIIRPGVIRQDEKDTNG